MKILNEKPRQPNVGDKFFEDTGRFDEMANLRTVFQEFGGYAYAYQNGALSLLDASFDEPENKDLLVYPVIFLIRHYLELRLKELMQGLIFITNQQKPFPDNHKLFNDHSLVNLWDKFKLAYSKIGQEIDGKILKSVNSLIIEVNIVDPKSISFRYPIDKNGKGTKRLEKINITNLRESFIRICFFFDELAMQIADYVENTEEMIRDIYDDRFH